MTRIHIFLIYFWLFWKIHFWSFNMSEMGPKVVLSAYALKNLHFPENTLRVKQSALPYVVYRHDTYKLPLLPIAIYQSEIEQEPVPDFAQLLVSPRRLLRKLI